VWRCKIDGGCCFEESVVLCVVEVNFSGQHTDDSSVGRLNKRSNWLSIHALLFSTHCGLLSG
jgi:hypothetical protein